ncbi:septum formation initiator [Megasphaera cerevisiae DSM 20462]|uniref:Septum formation initiator n=1 Tax=Megasphaera cerevisiae DSM 20462 TaxID=1122219 RepID=A0A0J6WR02_9FIRM|nr:septum formation initiator family protein [Megasphaera cerevisiae]KMO85880.1 septum formation initiator [Megasphaera cerevisiae DSM 20462]OKY53000.1 septum formation initiator [Megasphaera cerevisiae]SJZ57158.1 Cell division protein FtsB [Megasphaera cerevisiae DSM 20462]
MKPTGRNRRAASAGRRVRRRKKTAITLYRSFILIILILGGVFLCSKIYELWRIHEDMNLTVQQKQELSGENQKLKQQKDTLSDADEIAERAREQFGLVKPGEIPYKR